MPEKDYLGKDQRKVKDDVAKKDEPIKGKKSMSLIIGRNIFKISTFINSLRRSGNRPS